jgi:hypothetical protein
MSSLLPVVLRKKDEICIIYEKYVEYWGERWGGHKKIMFDEAEGTSWQGEIEMARGSGYRLVHNKTNWRAEESEDNA